MLVFFYQRWFLIALVTVLLLGIARPDLMDPVANLLSGDAILATVTFTMALPLATGALWRAVRQPGPAWLAAAVNSGIAPPLGWLASRLLPPELAVGMVVATTVPCTLASAAVWTRRAGGNDAVAFLVTMITNLACFLVIPSWLVLLVDIRADVGFGEIVFGLVLLVVLPIALAQLLRQWRLIGEWATRQKSLLSGIAQIGVLWMVFIGAVECGVRLSEVEGEAIITPGNLTILFAAVVVVHVLLLILGFALARLLSFDRADTIAVAFAGSQKTLMVGAYLAMAVGPLAILPMVAYHATQLILDTLIADRLRAG